MCVWHGSHGSPPPASAQGMAPLALAVLAAVSAEGPCDVTGRAGNPCVAAHSTVRALFAGYTGPLYAGANQKTLR